MALLLVVVLCITSLRRLVRVCVLTGQAALLWKTRVYTFRLSPLPPPTSERSPHYDHAKTADMHNLMSIKIKRIAALNLVCVYVTTYVCV